MKPPAGNFPLFGIRVNGEQIMFKATGERRRTIQGEYYISEEFAFPAPVNTPTGESRGARWIAVPVNPEHFAAYKALWDR